MQRNVNSKGPGAAELARALGKKSEARTHLLTAIERSARVGLSSSIELAKRELTRT